MQRDGIRKTEKTKYDNTRKYAKTTVSTSAGIEEVIEGWNRCKGTCTGRTPRKQKQKPNPTPIICKC
jgi:hypothetical protein